MNKVILIGRLTRDPEARTSQGGEPVARFTLAVDRRGRERAADFIGCVAFGKTAESVGQYLRKGSRVGVCGRIQTGSYERDGRKVYTTDVIADEVEFLETRAAAEQAAGEYAPPPQPQEVDDELPF